MDDVTILDLERNGNEVSLAVNPEGLRNGEISMTAPDSKSVSNIKEILNYL